MNLDNLLNNLKPKAYLFSFFTTLLRQFTINCDNGVIMELIKSHILLYYLSGGLCGIQEPGIDILIIELIKSHFIILLFTLGLAVSFTFLTCLSNQK